VPHPAPGVLRHPSEPDSDRAMKRVQKECMDARRETCPFVVPVVSDHLWMYPVAAFCRRPEHRPRVPATDSLLRLCMREYEACPGYRASMEARQGTVA
jgi:hypothetical protein